MVSIGIDIGSVCTKAAAFDGKNINRCMMPTGWNPREAGREAYEKLLVQCGATPDQVIAVVATGYGRISVPFADKKVTEITCHGRGAVYLQGRTRTIIDVGGQDSKAISIDENGKVLEFIMNDKCAAGTGRFLQVMAGVLETEVDRLEELAKSAEPRAINSMCAVFAESEVVSLLAEGTAKESIASGILYSISNRLMHIASRVALKDDILFTGGVASNSFIRQVLSQKLRKEIHWHEDSQYAGAIGAALIGYCR